MIAAEQNRKVIELMECLSHWSSKRHSQHANWTGVAKAGDTLSSRHVRSCDVNAGSWDVTGDLTFWNRSFTFNSNKSPTWCNSFSVYYPDVCSQLNMFRAFSRPSSGAQWLQWQPLVLPSYRGDSRAVFVVGPDGRKGGTTRTLSCCITRYWQTLERRFRGRLVGHP